MVRYVSTIITDAVVGFLSYWPAWITLIMLYVWAKIAIWRTGKVQVAVEGDAEKYYNERRRVFLPIALLIGVLVLTIVFISLVTHDVFSFTWYDFSVVFGIPENVADVLLFFGPAICSGLWAIGSLIVFAATANKKEKYAEHRAAMISLIASAVVCLIFVGVGFAVRANIEKLIISLEKKPVIPF